MILIASNTIDKVVIESSKTISCSSPRLINHFLYKITTFENLEKILAPALGGKHEKKGEAQKLQNTYT